MNLKTKLNSHPYHYSKAGRVAAMQRRSLSKRSAATRPARRLFNYFFTPFILLMLGFSAGMIYADIAWIDILNSADLETICGPN